MGVTGACENNASDLTATDFNSCRSWCFLIHLKSFYIWKDMQSFRNIFGTPPNFKSVCDKVPKGIDFEITSDIEYRYVVYVVFELHVQL